MQQKALNLLFVATVVTVGIAVASSFSRPGSIGTGARGNAVFGGLAEKANSLTAVMIDAGDWQAELKRQGEQFVDASGYPVKLEPIRSMITGLATLTYEEAKTADPTRYSELELADPGPEVGAGRLVKLLNGETVVASLIVGERDLTVGGMRGGIFARLPDDPQSWLLRGAVDLPTGRGELFESQLLGLNTNQVARVTVADNASGESLVLVSGAAGEPLTAPDSSLPVDPAKVLALSALVNNLQFADVRPATADAAIVGSVTYQTRDGMIIAVDRLAVQDADIAAEVFGWLRLNVSAGDQASDKTREQVAALKARTDGYEFSLFQTAFDTLSGGPAGLLKKPEQG